MINVSGIVELRVSKRHFLAITSSFLSIEEESMQCVKQTDVT